MAGINDLYSMTRLISGILLAAISLFCIFTGSIYVAVEILLLSLIALNEFYELARKKHFLPSKATGIMASIILVILVCANHLDWMAYFITIFVLITLIVFLFRKAFHVSPLLDASVTIMGVMYITWLFSYAILLRNLSQGEWRLTLVVLGTSLYDTAAYYCGRYLGRRPLWPNVSPGKTLEGTIGGTLFSILTTMIISWQLGWPLIPMLGLGVLIAAMAQLGDL